MIRQAFFALLLSSCTFYTNCPDQAGADPGTSGTGGTGGGGGGSSGSGASGGTITGGPVEGEWQSALGNLADVIGECSDVSYLSSVPGDGSIIAGLADIGLFVTSDGGQTWAELGQGEDSEAVTHVTTSILYDPEDPSVFWEAGIYGFGSGGFVTEDGGETFRGFETLFHIDSLAVDFQDPERLTMLATGHEQGQKLFKSEDGGETWVEPESEYPNGIGNCAHIRLLDRDTYLWGCPASGILRSDDGGETWTRVSAGGGWAEPLLASDGAIYWSSERERGVVRSDDGGETWTQIVPGAALRSAAPIELPDGRIAAMGNEAIVVSADRGQTWTAVTPGFSNQMRSGLAYSESERAFFVWHVWCDEGSTLGDAILRFDFDYEAD